jgi:ornithine carbamoyltransferase
MKDFVSFLDHDPALIRMIVEDALAIKQGTRNPKNIAGKTLGMLFFNPSLRTSDSVETPYPCRQVETLGRLNLEKVRS